jgi:subtilisin family serine protease
MLTVLRSPRYDLSPFEEVYVELWFYAKNEMVTDKAGKTEFPDVGSLVVRNASVKSPSGRDMRVRYDGDCTRDPTTRNGWRRLLFRVPPSFRKPGTWFELLYRSNAANRFEGIYIDDVRIVATHDVDVRPLGNDLYGGRHWGMRNTGQIAGLGNDGNDMHVPEAWDLVKVSPEVVLAVIDSGVELNHPDLRLVQGYDSDGSRGGGPKSARDDHGTSVAGDAGAIKDNARGVVGTAPGLKIMPVYRGSTPADFAGAIDVAVGKGARILCNSWGWQGAPSRAVEDAVKDAVAANAVVLFAAGNGPDRAPWSYDVVFPGRLTGECDVICVGASSPTDEHKSASSSDGEFTWGSSYVGPGPDVCAPGPWSYSTDRLGKEGYNDGSSLRDADYDPGFTGTSSATPKVAGIVALMLSANPSLTPAQVKSILRKTADDIGEPGVDDRTGAGRVNALKAVRSALDNR